MFADDVSGILFRKRIEHVITLVLSRRKERFIGIRVSNVELGQLTRHTSPAEVQPRYAELDHDPWWRRYLGPLYAFKVFVIIPCTADSCIASADYPWDALPAGTRVCDVGGNKGHVSMALLRTHAHLKVVVQDLPNVIEDVKKVCLACVAMFPSGLTLYSTALDLGSRHGRPPAKRSRRVGTTRLLCWHTSARL